MSGRKLSAGTIVEVEWWDSERVTLGWAPHEDYMEALRERSLYRTAGYFVGETKDALAVALSRGDNGDYSEAMVIPQAVVKSRRVLA